MDGYLDRLFDEPCNAVLVSHVDSNGRCVAAGLVDFTGYRADG